MYANTSGQNYATAPAFSARYMQDNIPIVSNRLYSPDNITDMKSHLQQMLIRAAEQMERQYEGQILETKIMALEKAFGPMLGNVSFFGPAQAAAEEPAPILGNASFVEPVQGADEDPNSRSTVGKIFSSAVGPEKHDSPSTYSQILGNDMHNVDASSATEQEQVQTNLPIEEEDKEDRLDDRPGEQSDRQLALQLQKEFDQDFQSEELQKQAKYAEEKEESETKVPRFLDWCYESTDITKLVQEYEAKPLNNFSKKQLQLLSRLQEVWDRTESYNAVVTYGVRDGLGSYEENKKIWKLAHQDSIGEIVGKRYCEAQNCDTDEKYFKAIKRCWYKSDVGDGGSFAKDKAEQLSRFDTMVYLNWKKIAVNDCMGLGKFSYMWYTNFKVAGA